MSYLVFQKVLVSVKKMKIHFSHTFREANNCADRLAAALDHINCNRMWWSFVPNSLVVNRDNLGFSFYRFM